MMYPINLLGKIADIKTIFTNLAAAGVEDTSRVQLGACFHGEIALYVDGEDFGTVNAETLAITVFTPASSDT